MKTKEQPNPKAQERLTREGARGEKNGRSKLTAVQVYAMRVEYADGMKLRELAAKYGVSSCVVCLICHGKRWLNIGGPIASADCRRPGRAKLTADQVKAIRVAYLGGRSRPKLAADFGVSKMAVRNIVHGKTWRHVGGPIRAGASPAHGGPKLSPEAVMAIREEYANSGISQQQLATKYNVGHTAISSALSRKRWKNVKGVTGTPTKKAMGVTNGHAKLTDDQVLAIRLAYSGGQITQKELSVRYGVSDSVIAAVVKRKSWKHVVEVSREDAIRELLESASRKAIDPERRLSDADAAQIFSLRGNYQLEPAVAECGGAQ